MGAGGIPLYVVAGRIVAFLGMGLGASLGIFLLVGGLWLAGIIALALFPLSLGLLLLVEWLGERSLRRGAGP